MIKPQFSIYLHEKMRKVILASVLLLLPLMAMAQVKDNEIGLSVGLLPVYPSTAYNRLDQRVQSVSGMDFDYYDFDVSGTVNIDYLRRFSKRFAAGFTAGYSKHSSSGSAQVTDDFPHESYYYLSVEDRVCYLAPQARWIYAQSANEHFRFYARAFAGLSIQHAEIGIGSSSRYSSTRLEFAGQLSPLGIDWGGDHFRGFFETGFGHQGMFIFGVRGCF